jgi:pimeloyl-ACP methyl ester carboxylesterase
MASDSMKSKKDAARGKNREFVEAHDGTPIFTRDWGKGRTMVFVAPWALNSRWWELQMMRLVEQGARCVAYDRRGHGRSGQPDRGYDFDTLADDIASVFEQLDLREVTLVGHSMGCGEVVHYLSRHGASRVSRTVLIGTITPGPKAGEADTGSTEKGLAGLIKDPPAVFAGAAAAFFGTPKNSVSEETKQWWTRMMADDCSFKAIVDLFRVFRATDFRSDLSKVHVPTLIVHGDSDVSTPLENAKSTAALIAGSRLEVYENAAHGLPSTHAERLSSDLFAFANG